MSVAYVDTSWMVAIAFGEAGARSLAKRLAEFDELLSSNLLEAELRAAFARERVATDSELLTWLSWVLPDRPLSREITQVLSAGYARGADLWHLASALYVVETPREMSFLSLDTRQAALAERLGFAA